MELVSFPETVRADYQKAVGELNLTESKTLTIHVPDLCSISHYISPGMHLSGHLYKTNVLTNAKDKLSLAVFRN